MILVYVKSPTLARGKEWGGDIDLLVHNYEQFVHFLLFERENVNRQR